MQLRLSNNCLTTHLPPVSDLSCGHPGIPANGKLTGTNYNFDSTVYYQCKTGWKLVGDVSRVCTSKARWTGKTPLCESK